MYPVSQAFKAAVRTSHRALVRVEVRSGDALLRTVEPIAGSVDVDGRRNVRRTISLELAVPDPEEVIDAQSGTYFALARDHVDYAALAAAVDNYGDLVVTVAERTVLVDSGLVPGTPGSALAPFGNEIWAWRGVEGTADVVEDRLTYGELRVAFTDYADLSVDPEPTSYFEAEAVLGEGSTYGDASAEWATYADATPPWTYGRLNPGAVLVREATDELVPLGVFVITKAAVKSGPGGVRVTVNGSDRSLRISRNRWTAPYTVPAGSVADGLRGLLEDRWAPIRCVFVETGATMSQAVLGLEAGNDPWADAVKIAAAAGLELYFDQTGVCRLDPVPDYAATAAVEVYLQNDEAMILDLDRSLTAERTYNGAIVTGEGSDAAAVYRGEAWDDDPSSPTYRYGPFGPAPQFFASPLITSDEMAQATAVSILAKKLGLVEAVQWTQIVDPSLDSGDVVGVHDRAAKVDRLLVLDRLEVPLLVTDAMSAVARAVRVMGSAGFDDDEGS